MSINPEVGSWKEIRRDFALEIIHGFKGLYRNIKDAEIDGVENLAICYYMSSTGISHMCWALDVLTEDLK